MKGPKMDFTYGTKAWEVYNRLRKGPATSRDLIEVGGFRYGARVFDINTKLYDRYSNDINFPLWEIKSTCVSPGLYLYELRRK